jgi:hypothetical protein
MNFQRGGTHITVCVCVCVCVFHFIFFFSLFAGDAETHSRQFKPNARARAFLHLRQSIARH